MARLRKVLARLILACAALAVVAYACLAGYIRYEAYRAYRMLDEAAQVKIGDTEDSILPITKRYNAEKWVPEPLAPRDQWVDLEEYDYQQKLKVDYVHQMSVSAFDAGYFTGKPSDAIDRLGSQMPPQWRQHLGFRIWSVILQFRIRNGRVQTVSTQTLVEGQCRWLGNWWSLSQIMPRTRMKPPYQIGSMHLTIYNGGVFGGSAISNYFTPAASGQEQQVARSFNRDCLTRRKACADLEELAPNAFEYLRHHPDASWNISLPRK